MSELAQRQAQLIEKQRPVISQAIEAVETRISWSPFKDSPSSKIHGPDKSPAGKLAYESRLNKRFEIDQPNICLLYTSPSPRDRG